MRAYGKCWLIGLMLTLLAACMVPSAKQNNSAQTITYTPMKTNVRPAPRFKLEKPSVLDETESENTQSQQPAAANSPDKTVRVLILENSKSAYIKHSGRVNIYTQDKSKKYKISQAGTVSVKPAKNGQVQVGTLVAKQPIFIEPVGGATLTLDKNGYTGIFKVVPGTNTFNIIEFTPLENYLYGVLPHEMHHTWALEALKAQAASLEKEISLLQRGDDSGSYWKGKNAYSSIEKCLNQIDSNRNLIDNLKKCSLYLDSLVQK